MQIPNYTELSNFSTRKNGQKVEMDLTIAMVLNRLSEPVNTINSIYNYLSNTDDRIEVIIISIDREGYNYDSILKKFPVMRVLLPESLIGVKDIFGLVAQESLGDAILFIDDDFNIQSIDLNIMNDYFAQSTFGVVVPLIRDIEGSIVPNIVKVGLENGFLNTISMDIKGTAITSIFPKYFCFIINRNLLIEWKDDFCEYKDNSFVLLELGYTVWKKGFFVVQAPSFHVEFSGYTKDDIYFDVYNTDYLLFNLININEKKFQKAQKRKIRQILAKLMLTFRFKKTKNILKTIKQASEHNRNIGVYPIDDTTVVSVVNKDYNIE